MSESGMIDAQQFTSLIARVRDGDQEAAAELIRNYEPLIRREVRLRLEDSRLRSTLDTLDVCQSVLASFFVRANLGEYQLEDPSQLIRLLMTMTRNKVASLARHQYRQKRDRRRTESDEDKLAAAPAHQATPSQIVADQELIDRARKLLPGEDYRIADLRNRGLTWEQVAQQIGGTAQACRVRFGRAVHKVLEQLGIGDE